MILVSRPPNAPIPSPAQALDEDIVAFLQRPYEDDATGDFPIATPAPKNPQTRDRLLTYAYTVYDTFVTRELPVRSIPLDHAALLLPLLELLHGLYPYNSSIALLLGCVYHYHNLLQRSLQINRHILQYDPDNVSAMCNLGANLRLMSLPVQAFEYWWRALRLSPTNWDILDNMLETFLGSKGFNAVSASPAVSSDSTLHMLQIKRQALHVCNFVMGHLPENPLRMEEVHRAQNIFRTRALLLQSLQEVGGWEDLVDGIEIGINTLTPSPSPADSVRPKKATFDDLLLRAHCIGTSICDKASPDASFLQQGPLRPHDGGSLTASVGYEDLDVPQSLETSEWRILHPALLLFPDEATQLLLMLWPSTRGSLPSVIVSAAPGNSRDDVRMERLKALTNTATSRLLRAWATRVQGLVETRPSAIPGHTMSATIPSSIFQATQSLPILAKYLALALSPTAMSYNDLGILLSSLHGQSRVSRSSSSSSSNDTTGRDLSRVYFEAGLEVDPHNVHLLVNLGSYWKKEENYEEAIRCYQLALAQDPEFIAARVCLERALEEIESDFEGVRGEPTYQNFD